jgi:diguanylate cyclase (GGDEF)-like protein
MIPSLHDSSVPSHSQTTESQFIEIKTELQKLEAREWWLWSLAVVVMLLLTFAVFSLSFPQLAKDGPPLFQMGQNEAVRGLIALIFLFIAYTVYQRVLVKRLRRQFTEQFGEILNLQARAEEFQKLSMIDPLTGLYNRRLAEDRIAAEVSRASRYGQQLTLLALDLDNLKQINDAFGHAAGDQMLKEFAARIISAIRVSDLAARMGGDEFLVLLPACPLSHMETLLARLRHLETNFSGRKIPVRFSAGWVAYIQGETIQQFVERADHALYENKRAAKQSAPQTLPQGEMQIQ